MRLPSFVTKIASSVLDLEKGQSTPAGQAYSATGLPQVGSTPDTLPPVNRDPRVQEALNEFRHYVGIHNDADLAIGRPVANLGIYQRIVKQELKYKKQFSTCSWLINAALGLQLIFAAALTALGAGNGPRSAVTAIGAMNTVIAGFLTYLKGSGLPNRLKYYREQLSQIREYIEQREREFARGDVDVDLKAEVTAIEDMYDLVRRDIEANTPEAYVSRTKESAAISGAQLERSARRATRELDDRIDYMDEKVNSARRGLERGFSDARLGAESRYKDTRSGIEGRLNSVRNGLQSQFSQEKLAAEARYRDTRSSVDDKITNARNRLDSRLSQERSSLEKNYSDARVGAEAQYQQARHGVDEQYQQTRSNVEDQVNTAKLATAAQVENTRHGLESRIEDTRSGVAAQVEESRHGVESRIKEVQAQVQEQEDKIMSMAEKVAEKVLAVTQHRHDHDQK